MVEKIIGQITPGMTSLYLLGVLILLGLVRKFQVSKEIARLGTIDLIYRSIGANKRHQDPIFWNTAIITAEGSSCKDLKTAELDAGISNRAIFTKDPENIKAILAGQFADYGKGPTFHRDWKEFLGDSIFVTDGEMWSRSRHLIRPMFVRERIVDTEIFEKHVQHLIPLLSGGPSPTGSRIVDVSPFFFRYTLDAATDYLLGHGTDSLQNPTTMFSEAFRYVQKRQADLFRLGTFNFLLSRKEFRRNLKIMDDFMQPYIDRVLSLSPAELDQKLSKKDTFLDSLARFTRDPRVLRDQLVAILLAGRDTTAATLSFCIYELARSPNVVAKLRHEINDRLGLGPNAQKPTYTDLKEMKYLNAVLNETMRLYPVVPFNVRFSLHDTTLPRGGGPDGLSPIGVRASTRVIYSTMLMQRDPANYDLPNSFDPEKFLPDRWVSGWQPKPWRFIPFNGGPRICLGQQFATIEMGYTVVRVLQAFQGIKAFPVSGEDTVKDPVLRFEVTLSPGAEMNCLFMREGEDSQLTTE
ncbi:hypothetical protein BBP40_005273 [Aspergillus hancockii]|nr:hypothetical protein BBP40_005273 [Aspergillus hancockii]